jgi:hypothetical protein
MKSSPLSQFFHAMNNHIMALEHYVSENEIPESLEKLRVMKKLLSLFGLMQSFQEFISSDQEKTKLSLPALFEPYIKNSLQYEIHIFSESFCVVSEKGAYIFFQELFSFLSLFPLKFRIECFSHRFEIRANGILFHDEELPFVSSFPFFPKEIAGKNISGAEIFFLFTMFQQVFSSSLKVYNNNGETGIVGMFP